MGKINKYANIYDKSCTTDNCQEHLLRSVGEDGILHDYTLEELEKLVDDLGNDKDENGKMRNVQAFNNASAVLYQYYQKYGNPHESEIIKAVQGLKTRDKEDQIKDALTDVLDDVTSAQTVMDEYVDYEEVKTA